MSKAVIHWVGGPVLRARSEEIFRVNDAVLIGERQLLGEVVRLDGSEMVIQVFEDTTGLKPGDELESRGMPLAAPLGPGLIGGIFDGLLRPLTGQGDFVKSGFHAREERRFPFTPTKKAGERLDPGGIFGEVTLFPAPAKPQKSLAPPGLGGEILFMVEAGEVGETEEVGRVRDADGVEHPLRLTHDWPVREPRPIRSRLPAGPPLLTGQRILDGLFPISRGGKSAIPGGFGTGKTVLLETIAKGCDADIIIYVGCGERGNELAGVLEEFPHLEDPRSGRPLMERTMVIANTSNMPVAAREASIYTGITAGEYFRDMGLHVALMADSTSRWAEALREVSGRLGELPGEGGYPAYLSTRLAAFYERAARVETLMGEEGSLSIMGAVSPPSSDFSEPVTINTKRYVRNFWGLDRKRAQARFYPAIDPLGSYSEDAPDLAAWWHEGGNPRWGEIRRNFLGLLEDQTRLERMARIVGKDSLPPKQRLTLALADLVAEGFLRQSAFSENDRFTSPTRLNLMMGAISHFIELAERAVDEQSVTVEEITALDVLRRLQRMGEEIAEGPEMAGKFKELEHSLEEAFNDLGDRHDGAEGEGA